MTSVIVGQTVTLLAQFYAYDGGPLQDLDATPSIGIVNIATGGVALSTTTASVTHPGTGSYGYAWTPATTLAGGSYLVTWSGLSSGNAVTASETVTVTGLGTSPSANDSEGVWYTTRESIKRALDIAETARNNRIIDRHISSASRIVEGFCHRRFYPYIATRKWDWPNIQGALPWRVWVDDADIISLTTLSTTGGGAIPLANVFLEPNRNGPPYDRIELDLSSASAFGGGSTYQRSIIATGLFGYTNNETTLGVTVEALDTTETGIDVDGPTSALVGVGSILRIDDERVIVTERSNLSTGQTITSALDAQQKTVTVPVGSGANFGVDETIVIDAERMLVVDIVGNNLTVVRAYDGTPIASHSSGATVYAGRTLTVRRGALGTTAAAHSISSTVYLWQVPGGIQELVQAMTISDLMQEQTGWFRTMSASSNFGGASRRAATLEALLDLKERVLQHYARKARQRTI
jgi:hypothetical protein